MDTLVEEAELQSLKLRLRSQAERHQLREILLDDAESKRLRYEYDKKQIKEKEKARMEEREIEDELQMIEEEEELKRRTELEQIRMKKRKDLNQTMTSLDQTEREDFLHDLVLIEELTDRLELSTERLERRKHEVNTLLELEEQRRRLQTEEKQQLLEEAITAFGNTSSEEESVRKISFLNPIADQRAVEQAAAQLIHEQQLALAAETQRRHLRNTLSESDAIHLQTLSTNEQEQVLDEVALLYSLKEKSRKLLQC